MAQDDSIDVLKGRIAKLEGEKKTPSAWDRVISLSSIVTPILVLVLGFLLNQSDKALNHRLDEQKAALDQQRLAIDQQKADIEADAERVTEGKLELDILTKYLDLIGDSKKKLSVAGVLVMKAMPNEGPQILRIVAEDTSTQATGGGGTIGQQATDALQVRRDVLIAGIYSTTSKAARSQAMTDLLAGWRNAPDVVPAVLAVASQSQNLANVDGTANALYVLLQVPGRPLPPDMAVKLRQFTDLAARNGPKTASQARQVLAHFSLG